MSADSPIEKLSAAALLGLTALAAALRLPGGFDLPLAPGEALHAPRLLAAWFGDGPGAARLLPLLAGVLAVPLAAAWLAPRAGRAVALAAALLITISPWHVHASRLATPESGEFLAWLLAIAGLVSGWPDRPLARARRIGWIAVAAALAITCQRIAPSPSVGAGRDFAPFLVADLGAGTLAFAALLPLLRGAAPKGLAAALLAVALLALRLAPWPHAWRVYLPPAADLTAATVVAVLVAAAFALGRLRDALPTAREVVALQAIAVLPCLPALIGEHQDGGRFQLQELATAFAERRQPGEPLFATCPELATRAFAVAARPLQEAIATSGHADGHASWLLLLLDRGQSADGETLPADLESQLSLVAVAAPRRFDLRRYEARLYRREPTP